MNFVCLFTFIDGLVGSAYIFCRRLEQKQDTSGGKRQLGHHQIGSQRPGTICLCGPKHGRHPRDIAGDVDSQR